MNTKDIKTKLKEYFFLNPTIKLRVRQIEREVKVPLPSVIRYTKELEQEKILKVTELAGVTFYSADRSSSMFLLEKKLFNLKQLYLSELITYLIHEYSNPPIVLFGSFARGEDTEESDIDLYIQSSSKKITIPFAFEKKLHRHFQVFHHTHIQEITNKHLANNILNGIPLNGIIEVFE